MTATKPTLQELEELRRDMAYVYEQDIAYLEYHSRPTLRKIMIQKRDKHLATIDALIAEREGAKPE